VTTPTAVARAVARDAEARAKAALEEVLAAHARLTAAEEAIAAATTARAAAGPALARAVTAALATGITAEQMAELGVTVPSPRTLRRTGKAAQAATGSPGGRPPAVAGDGHSHPRFVEDLADDRGGA
jgi:hypothetical protein